MASRAGGCGYIRPARGPASPRERRGRARRSRRRSRPRWSSLLLWRRVADIQRATVRRELHRGRARDVETEPVDVATLLDVAQLVRIVVRGEQLVLWTDHGDGEWWRHECAVHHDGRADAVDARRSDDTFAIDRDGLRTTAPRGVDDIREIRRVTDRLVDVARLPRRRRTRVVERDHHPIAGPLGEAGRGAELFDARLQVAAGGALGRGAALDVVELIAQIRELCLERVLLVLQRVRGVEQGRVVTDGELAALLIRPPLK